MDIGMLEIDNGIDKMDLVNERIFMSYEDNLSQLLRQ
jgi:hypothetical protein